MERPPKSKEINLKSLKRSKNERSRISKEKRTTSSSSNERDTNSERKNQKKILLIVKKYSVNEDQNELEEIL